MSSLSDYLLEIKSKLEWSNQEMCDRLMVSEREWLRIATGRQEPSLVAATRFSESIDVDLEHLINREVDLKLLARRYHLNEMNALPERYSAGTFSKMRTARSLLEFVEFNFGWRHRQRLLRGLQMNEIAVMDLERPINMRFFSDICELMQSLGHGPELLYQMGRFSVYSNRNGVVGKLFSDCLDPKEVYERLVPVLGQYFERNHSYRILSLGESFCEIEARVSEELQDALKVSRFGSLATCHARRGIAGSFALYAGEVKADVVETECIHRGDDRCVYHVTWQDFRLPA